MTTQTIVIAGGGITGITAAYRLQQAAKAAGADARIIVVEKEKRLGGKVQTDLVDGFVIEHGPDSYIVHKPWMRDLCHELGLPTVGTDPTVKTTYIYGGGRMEPLPVGMQIMIPTEIWPFLKSRLISPLGKLRAGLEPLVPKRQSEADESIGSFVSRRFGREVMENIAGPLMGGIYGGDWDSVSINATFPMFPKMEREQGSLLLGAMRSKANKPKGPTGSAFNTVPVGLEAAIEALIQASPGVEYRTGTTMTSATPASDGKGYTVLLDGEEQLLADAVVLAVPAYVASSLVGGYLPEVAEELDTIPYGNSCVMALAYDRADVKHPLDASGFLVPHTEPLEVTAGTWVSVKWPHAAPEGKVLMRCFLGRAGGKDWTQESDETIIATVRQGLAKVMGLEAEPLLTRIFRWRRAMSQYRVGHLDRMDRVDRLMEQMPGLYLAGAAYRGVGLPDCVREGTQAAKKAATHLGWK